jgi:hypothetical protein
VAAKIRTTLCIVYETPPDRPRKIAATLATSVLQR